MRIFKQAGIALIFLLASAGTTAKNQALLVGVSDYPSQPLEGPVYDVAALKKVLIEKWSFKDGDIVTLVNQDATKNRILTAVDGLYARTKPGDNVFVYFSGHGTSSLDRDIRAPLPTTSGAFIPYDVAGVKTRSELMQRLVIGRQDLRPRFKQFDDNGRHLFVAIDACYSGNTVRGLFNKERLPARNLSLNDLVPRGFGDDLSVSENEWEASNDEEDVYPYTNTFYLGASGEHEKAEDIPSRMLNKYQTIDNKPHGAFTNSLLEFFYAPEQADGNKNGHISYAELRQALKERMGKRGFNHTPQGLPTIEQDDQNLAQQDVFFLQTRSIQIPEQKDVVPAVPVTPTVPVTPVTTPPKLGTSKQEVDTQTQLNKHKVDTSAAPTLVDSNLKVKIPTSLHAIGSMITQQEGLSLSKAGQYDVELVPKGKDAIILTSNAGDVITTINVRDNEAILKALQYEKWMSDTLLSTNLSASSVRLEVSFSGLAKGSAAIEGEDIGFDIKLPDGGYLMILDYEPGGYVNVIYPYDTTETKAIRANSKLKLHNLMKVQAPFGRDKIHVVAFSSVDEAYSNLINTTRFHFESTAADNIVRLMSNKKITKAAMHLQLITAPK